MDLHKHALLLDFSVTIAALYLTFEILRRYYKPALRGYRSEGRDPVDDMIIGISILLLGVFVSRLYWVPPFLMAIMGDPETRDWFQTGILVDLPIREGSWVVSCFFLLRGILGSTGSDGSLLNKILWRAVALGIFVWMSLLLLISRN